MASLDFACMRSHPHRPSTRGRSLSHCAPLVSTPTRTMASNAKRGGNMSARHDLDWHQAFGDGPLSRGLSCFKRGLVQDLHHDHEGWHATVPGSWDYEVTVATLKDGTPDPFGANPSCTCPYFCSAGPCKHIAATCFAIEELQSVCQT